MAEDDRRGGPTVEQSFKRAPMVTGDGWVLPAGEKPGWRLGRVEEELGKVPMQGIEGWSPEGGDRREGGGGLLCSSSGSTGKKRIEWKNI